ncbi:glucose-6-phosphate dehydrogenase [Nocardioides sp. NPDC127514]|uniref:glucose-6-phosphate dehydrogenase n=1 Tax=unclassified Nocardioides TaxID=2615069 RepID=UPI00332E139E
MTISEVEARALDPRRVTSNTDREDLGTGAPPLDAVSLVIFGITGDLARKKLIPAIYDLAFAGQLPHAFDVVGFARNPEQVDDLLRESVAEHSRTPFDSSTWQRLRERLHVVQGSFDDRESFERLADKLRRVDRHRHSPPNYVFYLSVPPSAFATVCDQLAAVGLSRSPHGWRRVVIEKPFGHDLTTARELEVVLDRTFEPASIYRIDHYLGKETVQNILAVRFANPMFEPLWNNRHVDHVQITMAEAVGLGGRAGYYDGVGAARDVAQNHMLQLMALVAMEEPTTFDADAIAAEKAKVLSSTTLTGPFEESTARGQYVAGTLNGEALPGLVDEPGFPARSTTETFAAMTLGVATRRWAGVPFFIRTGKRMARRHSEIAVSFSSPLQRPDAFGPGAGQNMLVFRVQPDDGIELLMGAKRPGGGLVIEPVALGMQFDSVFGAAPEAYERLLHDILAGDATLFPRRDEIEWSWRIMDPLLEHWARNGRPEPYSPGGAGPASAERIMARTGRAWRPV